MMNQNNNEETIRIEDESIEKVDHYVYFKQEMTIGKSNQENEVNRRLRLT